MKMEYVLRVLCESDLCDHVRPFWNHAMADYPADGIPPFLDPARISAAREFGGFPAEADAPLRAIAERAQADPALRPMAWYIDWRNFECPDREALVFPSMEKALGEQAGVFWLLMSLAWIPRLREYHGKLGIPERITRDTAREAHCFSLNYAMANDGRLGLFYKQYNWFRSYLGDNLYFRIGRFEYWLKPFSADFMVFRHRVTGRVAALAADGVKVTSAGFIDGLKDASDPDEEWTTSLCVDGRAAEGNPISPGGTVLREKVSLQLDEWECVLKKGTLILDMHIPAGGNMEHAKCGESMRDAVNFFGERRPEKRPAAIVCAHSWMFSPLLEKILSPEANLVKYLRELHLFPVAGGGTGSLWFVFFQDQLDPATAPRRTSLQRALLDYLAPGRAWHNGGMFILTDDVKHYGAQHYRVINSC